MKIDPGPGIFVSTAAQNLPWKHVLGELIDNAFDADARQVAITFGRGEFVCRDDGRGTDNLGLFFRVGVREEKKSTRIGHFGVGAKDALLSLGGIRSTVTVESHSGGFSRSVDVCWAQVGANWETGTDPVIVPSAPGERGTKILVRPSRPALHGEQWKNLVSEIGYLYAPGIRAGRQITLAREKNISSVPAWEFPRFEGEVISTEITVGSRRARVRAGVVVPGEKNPRAGLTYSHEFRVILEATSRGCGNYSIGRLCGHVELIGGWRETLSKNKTAVIVGEDELYQRVEEAILPVLKRAASASSILGCQEFETRVAANINAMMLAANAKAKRKPKKEETGTNAATDTGGKHKRAAVEQTGKTFPARRMSGGYRVEMANLGGNTLGEVKEFTVLVNLDNPFVRQIQKEGNDAAAVAIVASLIGDAVRSTTASGQRTLHGFESKPFAVATGAILSSGAEWNGRPVLRSAG